MPATAALAAAFRARTRAAAERLDERVVPKALRERIGSWLGEIRAAINASFPVEVLAAASR